jgi:hypothetical protein
VAAMAVSSVTKKKRFIVMSGKPFCLLKLIVSRPPSRTVGS